MTCYCIPINSDDDVFVGKAKPRDTAGVDTEGKSITTVMVGQGVNLKEVVLDTRRVIVQLYVYGPVLLINKTI